jgi:hypothetical protein
MEQYGILEDNIFKFAEDEFQLFLEQLDQAEKSNEDRHK